MENNPIRVLQVIGIMNSAGAENMIMNLYRKIDRNRVQFDFLVHTEKKGFFDDEIAALGGKIYHIKHFTGLNPISYYKSVCEFFDEHPGYVAVHGHIGSCAAIYLYAAKRRGIFTIAHSHSALKEIRNVHDLFYRIYSYPTRYIADQLFGCSRAAGIARYGTKIVNTEKYMDFKNAVEIEKYIYNPEKRKQIRDEFGLLSTDIVIGTVGRITPQKNPHKILEIFFKAMNENDDVKCIWAGTGDMLEEIREKINRSVFKDRIIMTGVRNDIDFLLQGFDSFLFPSLWEGLPVSLIEAQTSGLPCIVSNTITREVEVTDKVRWLGWDESDDHWSEICISEAKRNKDNRESDINSIKKSGYDIYETAKWLTNFYCSKK